MVYQQQASSQQSQRSVVGSHQQTGQHHNNNSSQQQQQQQLGQYMGQQHQQMQSNTHHGTSSAAAAAYYQQQAHMYQPPYQQSPGHNQQEQAQSQQQQQQTSQQHPNADYQTHHHLSGSNIPVTGQAPAGSVAGVHHHQQNSQNSALNHPTWSPGVGSLNPQTHHPVVTDHSAMAYLAHPYQSHTSTVSDHRNSTGPMGSQAGHQASSYPVDALYNSSSAAAVVAAAAYGYNNYNAAFFQTSSSGPHSQTGPISTFWNHNQPTQQQPQQQQQRQGPISQQQQQPTNTNQNSQQRQPTIGSEQAGTNFIHDPRMYYGGRPATYGQGLPNISQTPQTHQTQTQSAELMHHRMTGLPQLHQMFPAHHADLHQAAPVTHQATPGAMSTAIAAPHQTPIGQHPHLTSLPSTTSIQPHHHLTNTHNNQQHQPTASLSSTTISDNAVGAGQTLMNEQQPVGNRQVQPIKSGSQPPIQKQQVTSCESDKLLQRDSSGASKQVIGSDYGNQMSDSTQHDMGDSVDNVFQSGKEPLKSKDQQQSQQQSSANKSYCNSSSSSSQNVIKSEPYQTPYQKQQAASKESSAAPGGRPIYKSQQHQDDRPKLLQQNDNNSKTANNTNSTSCKSQASATDSGSSNYRLNQTQVKSSRSPPPTIIPDQPSPDQLSSLEDSMGSLTVSSPRKTTWASIASQPAKVTQPKSLKSKIAGSTSALSNAKHLAVVSLDSSSGESKNGGINPAIKSSVSAATTSLQRSSMPPPITKLPTVAASLKLDLLGDSIGPNSKISWPAVNASANLQSELLREKEAAAAAAASKQLQTSTNSMMGDNRYRSSNNYDEDRNRMPPHRDLYDRDHRADAGDDAPYKDHNHNQGSANMYNSSKMGNRDSYGDRDDGPPSSHHQREPWARRGGGNGNHDRDHHYHNENNRYRRDSDRDSVPNEFKEDLRDVLNMRRDNNNVSYRQNINGPNRVIGNNGPNHRADRESSADEPGFRDRGAYMNKQRPPLLDNRNKTLLRGNANNNNNNLDARDNHPNGPPPPRFSSQYNNTNGGRFGETRGHNSRAPYQQNSFRNSRDRGMDMPSNNREHDREDSRDDQDSSNHSAAELPTLNPSNYNPKVFDLEPPKARYFIIKSYSGDDIYRSIKYSIWCSTNHGNKKLDEAYRSQQAKNGSIYLFFSVNSSGHFCGMAQMTSAVDFDSSTGVWAQSKWQGEFSVKWIHVKDVPNNALRHIKLENNEDKPVTNSRDTQEVPSEQGRSVLKIIHNYTHSASIFDQFQHYERRQEEDRLKRSNHPPPPPLNMDHQERPPLLDGDRGNHDGGRHHSHHNQHHHPHNNRRFDDDRRGNGNDGGHSVTRFGGRPYINPRPHNDFHRGVRMGGLRGPPRGDGPAAPSDKPAGFPRENGGSPSIRNSGIKLTQ